jgi:hypothetical protein
VQDYASLPTHSILADSRAMFNALAIRHRRWQPAIFLSRIIDDLLADLLSLSPAMVCRRSLKLNYLST